MDFFLMASEINLDELIPITYYFCTALQDAASLSIAIMKKKLRSRIFVGCDNHPLSRYYFFFTSVKI